MLHRRLAPLEEDKLMLQAHRDALETEKRALLEENQRWRSRVTQLIEKSQRIDPVEVCAACVYERARMCVYAFVPMDEFYFVVIFYIFFVFFFFSC